MQIDEVVLEAKACAQAVKAIINRMVAVILN
jgi:hypothetical protein